jgi:hypothetical protein
MRKILVGGLAVAASLGLASGSALAGPPFNYNSAENWSEVLGLECEKLDDLDIPEWEADGDYAAVVMKGGSVDYGSGPGIKVYEDVMEGDVLYAPMNKGGNVADISWAMLCLGDDYPPYEPPYSS